MVRTRLLPVLLAAVVALAACNNAAPKPAGSPVASGPLPAGGALLTQSAAAMRDIKTVKMQMTADGELSGLGVRHAESIVTRTGRAQGTATVDQAGVTVDLSFIVVGDKIYIKGPTGRYQTLPLAMAAKMYDPSALLDPARGVAGILATTSGAVTEAAEQVGGRDAWRVASSTRGEHLASLIPGVRGEIPTKVWVAQDGKRMLKATFTTPSTSGTMGTMTVVFEEFDVPADIHAP